MKLQTELPHICASKWWIWDYLCWLCFWNKKIVQFFLLKPYSTERKKGLDDSLVMPAKNRSQDKYDS
jgi:hypothetical protein